MLFQEQGFPFFIEVLFDRTVITGRPSFFSFLFICGDLVVVNQEY
jgi:hypothetical protein